MKNTIFYKLSGAGNDFIIVDNRKNVIPLESIRSIVSKVCRRKMSVGADGFILIEDSKDSDFKWRFYNSDGSDADMCGNGARCAARFAFIHNIAGPEMEFETAIGIVKAKVLDRRVRISLPDPMDLRLDQTIGLQNGSITADSINTGVPHAVIEVDDIENIDVKSVGHEIRFHEKFAPKGTNVNFVLIGESNTISVRTYERGVEDETLACGTGAIASALIAALKHNKQSPVKVIVKSGEELLIYFDHNGRSFHELMLEGDARIIYKGEFWEDAWK